MTSLALSLRALEGHPPEPASCLLPGASWDGFVASAPGGDIVQNVAWAEAKRSLGFEAYRMTVRDDDDRVLAGVQLLMRRLGPLGAVGYIARGPLLVRGAAQHASRVLDRLMGASSPPTH